MSKEFFPKWPFSLSNMLVLGRKRCLVGPTHAVGAAPCALCTLQASKQTPNTEHWSQWRGVAVAPPVCHQHPCHPQGFGLLCHPLDLEDSFDQS